MFNHFVYLAFPGFLHKNFLTVKHADELYVDKCGSFNT